MVKSHDLTEGKVDSAYRPSPFASEANLAEKAKTKPPPPHPPNKRQVKIIRTEILVALISGAATLLGTALTCRFGIQKTRVTMEIHQAVTDEKLESLTREVREHNHFARRLPVVEEQIKVINHRLQDLEQSR